MAPRVAPTSWNAVNKSGSSLAVRSDWRFEVADSIWARAIHSSPQMPYIRLQGSPNEQVLSISLLIEG